MPDGRFVSQERPFIMAAVFWMISGCAVVLHRWHRRRKGKDLHKIPLAPGSFPVLGHLEIVKVLFSPGRLSLHHRCSIGSDLMVLALVADATLVLLQGDTTTSVPAYSFVTMNTVTFI